MNKIKSFFNGVIKEAKRIRWVKGEEMTSSLGTVLAYGIIVALFLVAFDWLVIKLLQAVNFS